MGHMAFGGGFRCKFRCMCGHAHEKHDTFAPLHSLLPHVTDGKQRLHPGPCSQPPTSLVPHAPISRQPLAPGTYAFSPLGRCALYLPWGPGTGRHWRALSVYSRVPVSVCLSAFEAT